MFLCDSFSSTKLFKRTYIFFVDEIEYKVDKTVMLYRKDFQ